jgi:putative pyruvate formate lyase activating enzyme
MAFMGAAVMNKPAGCTLCPRECGADRSLEAGFCNSTNTAVVNLSQLHLWEEPVLSGTAGSGAIFFSNCSMRCVYCQNHLISQGGRGPPRSIQDLCAMMIGLQEMGAHNVNLVTAGHYVTQAVSSLRMAREQGLCIPVVWNSSAYEKPETLQLLDGLVDVYLPDFRYFDPAAAARYSGAPDYPAWAKKAMREMFRQTGHLSVVDGIAARGIIIRLLVLPGQAESIRDMLVWIRDALGAETWISLMGQYYPAYRAREFPEINRPVTAEEYQRCVGFLEELGFENGFLQEVGSCAGYTPDFKY